MQLWSIIGRLSTSYYPVFRNTCSDSGTVNGCHRVLSGSEFKSRIAVCVQGSYGETLVSTNQIAVLYDVKVANPPQFLISIVFYLYTCVTPLFNHFVSLECDFPFCRFAAHSGLSLECFCLQNVRKRALASKLQKAREADKKTKFNVHNFI